MSGNFKGVLVTRIFIAFCIVMAVYGLITGNVWGFGSKSTGQNVMVVRSRDPLIYWFFMCIYFYCAVVGIRSEVKKIREKKAKKQTHIKEMEEKVRQRLEDENKGK